MKRNESMDTGCLAEEAQTNVESEVTAAETRRPRVRSGRVEGGLEVLVEMPGVAAEGVEVSYRERKLRVTGKVAAKDLAEGQRVLHRELPRGDFDVTLDLPQGVATDRIQAEMKAGLLTLSLPDRGPERHTIPVLGK